MQRHRIGNSAAFLGLLLFLSLSIIRPFIETVAWSVVWAVALYPVFDLVARWLGGRRRLAAALITVLLLLIVFGPVTWLGRDLLEVPRTISEASKPDRYPFLRLSRL